MNDDRALEALLQWYLAAGADEAIGEEPVDRFAETERRLAERNSARAAPAPARPASPPAAAPAVPAGPRLGPDSPATAIAEARAAAMAATTVEELGRAVAAFEGCSLKHTATNTVFADGNPLSRLMFIGEAPGADEDRIGRPFVGVSGQLLDRMLATIGLDRTSAYITNVLFWRPPGNRKPTEAEVAICRPFVERHIALVDPRLLIMVGGTASAALVPGSAGITRLRGRWMALEIPGLATPLQAMAMYHPSYLLRSPDRKRDAWADLLSIKSKNRTNPS
ncbi:MAG TPA: uracil-DNA glycosylase [Aliidongia sp.]|nr:uracil-DNA glycosylase [Aliidongia sp.]